jgi:Mrp family chromosome partitioning ATPase
MASRQSYERDDFASEPRSVDLRDYWLVVRRRWSIILVMIVVGAGLGAGYVLHTKPSYTATAEVLVSPATQGPLNMPSQPDLLVNMSTEQAVAQSAPVVAATATLLSIPDETLQAESASRLTVAVPVGSDVLQVTWQAGTAADAQAGARAFARAYLSYRHNELSGTISGLEKVLSKQASSLQKQISSVSTQLSTMPTTSADHQSVVVRLGQLTQQLTKANSQLASLPTYNDSGGQIIGSPLPQSPSGLGRSVVLALGVLLGLLLGLVLAFVRDLFDDRVRDAEQMERRLGVPTLIQLPTSAGDPGTGEQDGTRPGARGDAGLRRVADPRITEAVRTLRATLAAIATRVQLRSILIVAADSSVSSSRVVAELGIAIAESGRRVLLIAADMRGSTLPGIFELPDTAGLSDLLVSDSDPDVVTRHPRQFGGVPLPGSFAKRLAVLTGGSRAPQSVLDSGSMTRLLASQVETYDFVVLDCPSSPAAAGDVVTLATYVDSVIVLARAGHTKGRAVKDLCQRLGRVDAQVIGGVLIGKSRLGRHRQGHRASPPKLAAAPRQTSSGAERRDISRAERPGERPLGRSAAPARPDSGVDRQSERRSPPPSTRPLPVVPGDDSPRGSGSFAQRPL